MVKEIISENVLEQLKKAFKEFPHDTIDEDEDYKEWEKQGKPYWWGLAETEGKYSVYMDYGYGNLAVFSDGELIGYGLRKIITKEVVVLHRDYYETSKYIWT